MSDSQLFETGGAAPASPHAPVSGRGPGPTPPGREPARRWEVALGLAALAIFSYFALRWGMEGAVHNRKVQVVPDLKGKSLEAALDMVSPLNLAIRKEGSEFNASVPIGTILRQTPPSGAKVREGKILRVVLSQGGETVFVPNLIGLPLRNSEMLLRQGQLLLGGVTESYSLRMDKGMVLIQEPKAESSVERNTMVNVVISGGPPPNGVTLMPDFLRKNVSEATAWASGADVSVQVVKDPTSLFPYGTILAQDPPPDSVLGPGVQAKLTVSGRTGRSPGSQGAMRKIHYEVPQGSSDSQVRIVLVDPSGEQEIFNGLRAPGSKVDLDIPVPESGQARMKVYLNGILVEERDL